MAKSLLTAYENRKLQIALSMGNEDYLSIKDKSTMISYLVAKMMNVVDYDETEEIDKAVEDAPFPEYFRDIMKNSHMIKKCKLANVFVGLPDSVVEAYYILAKKTGDIFFEERKEDVERVM